MSECEREDCKNESKLSVGTGTKNNIHLCYECAALPEYKRLRKRVPLKRTAEDCSVDRTVKDCLTVDTGSALP